MSLCVHTMIEGYSILFYSILATKWVIKAIVYMEIIH